MKKILFMCLIGLVSIVFIGCQSPPPIIEDEQINELYQQLDASIPEIINSNVIFPVLDDLSLSWAVDGVPVEDGFIYQTPFIDRAMLIEATVQNGRQVFRLQFNRTLIASDSPNNVSKLFIETVSGESEIARRESEDIRLSLEGRINDELVILHEDMAAQIRGRGNSTWEMPKKPYRIRFPEAVSLLGLPETRTYVLLAEYADKSLLRNTLVHKFSTLLEHFDHTLTSRVVELYLNGEYQGIYTLTEQVELAPSKLYFETIPGVLNTGYFLELDHRFFEKGGVDLVDGFVVAGIPYELIGPDPSHPDFEEAQMHYIQNYFWEMEAALVAQSGYENYLDIDNWIDYFIVQELFKNVDVGWSSVYIYKKPGEVVRLGPLWDFDLAIGNADYIDYAPENWYGMRDHKNRWFKLMMAIPEVRERFKDRYLDLYEDAIPLLLEATLSLGDAMDPLAQRNFERWPILSHYVWPNPPGMLEDDRYEWQIYYLHQFISQRADWMALEVQSSRFAQGRFEP